MGCASSTPMIQTTGSEMLKAATHVASDATKSAEDAVQGVKDTADKTLETAKESVATTVGGIKHEVEHVVKEKIELLEDAKNSLMVKLHLSEATKDTELNDELASKQEAATEMANATDEKDVVETQHEIESTGMPMSTVSEREHILVRADTETDSLNTSIPEPEIEQALANSKHNDNNQNDDDDDDDDDDNDDDEDDDNSATPQPTLSELENLTAEVIQHQQQQQQQKQQQHETALTPTMVNDISVNNDLLMTATHDNMKSTDITTPIESSATTTTTYTSSSPHQTLSNTMHKISTAPLLPLPIATTVIATATSQHRQETQAKEKGQQPQQKSKKPKTIQKNHKEQISSQQNEQKRPRTTEWEKFADMLAQHRKYNPHDAFRRGGTLTKFGGNNSVGGGMAMRPSYGVHHIRGSGGAGDDDSSDTASNLRDSPQNSQRSSARAGGRIQRLPNRPNTGNQRKNHHEFSAVIGAGPKPPSIARRNSNALLNGRKFDYNPGRSRLNDYISTVSSIPNSSQSSSLQPVLSTQLPNAPCESVKSPAEMRPQHSHNRSRTPHHLEPLERPRSHSQQQHQPTHCQQQKGSSMPCNPSTQYHYTETLTRQSSKTSLFSNSSNMENGHAIKSSLDLRTLSTNPPIRNTSSFLTTPRCSPFSVRKSYTDLYFSTTSNKENTNNFTTNSVAKQRHLRDKSPYKVRDRCEVCCKKYVIK